MVLKLVSIAEGFVILKCGHHYQIPLEDGSSSQAPDMEEMMALWFTAIDSQGNSDGKIQLSEFLKTMGMLNQHMTDMKFEMWLMNIIELISPH